MRLQLALNVNDLDKAVEFYSSMFGVEVNKREPPQKGERQDITQRLPRHAFSS